MADSDANAKERADNSEQGWRRGVTIALAATSLIFFLNKDWIAGVGSGITAFVVLMRHSFRNEKVLLWTEKHSIKTPLVILLVLGLVGLSVFYVGSKSESVDSLIVQAGKTLIILVFVVAVALLMIWKEKKGP